MLQESKNDTLEYQKLSKEEMDNRGILGRLVGVCADFLVPTRNGRKYSEKLWENVFNDPIMKERIANGVCYGELGHPADREETDMEKIAICLSEQPKKGKDGKLRAVFDILNTPNGRILKSLCDYGSTMGISSRGSGDVITDYNGDESVDPSTYNCEGWDVVLIPAVKEARLQYVTESLNKKRYNKTLRDKLAESISAETEENQKIMTESLNNLGIHLNEELFNEATYTRDELIKKFGTDDLDIIDAGNEEDVRLNENINITVPEFSTLDNIDIESYIYSSKPFKSYDGNLAGLKAYGTENIEFINEQEAIEFCESHNIDSRYISLKGNYYSVLINHQYICVKQSTHMSFTITQYEGKSEKITWAGLPITVSGVDVEGDINTKNMLNAYLNQPYAIKLPSNAGVKPSSKRVSYYTYVFEDNKSFVEDDSIDTYVFLENCNETTFDESQVDNNNEVNDTAVDDDKAVVEELQEALSLNRKLDGQIVSLKERLSVSYAKESELLEEINMLKDKVNTLSKAVSNVKQLNAKINSLEESLKRKDAQNEKSKVQFKESLDKKTEFNSRLSEDLEKKESKINMLLEKLDNSRNENKKLSDECDKLNEQVNTYQKDFKQLKEQYSKKVTQQNTIIEKYQKIALNSINKYIDSQATRLGIKPEEIKNRLPESYGFKDIDKVCEDLQEYKLNVNSLPFNATSMLNENIKLSARNVKSDFVHNSDDDVTDYDLRIAGLV